MTHLISFREKMFSLVRPYILKFNLYLKLRFKLITNYFFSLATALLRAMLFYKRVCSLQKGLQLILKT